MRNAGLDEAQAGIEIAGRNINKLRYADDTTLNSRKQGGTKEYLDKGKRNSTFKKLRSWHLVPSLHSN